MEMIWIYLITDKSTNVCCTYIFYVSYSKLIIKYKIIIKFTFCSNAAILYYFLVKEKWIKIL